jgi:hypothetical protein
MDENKGRGDEDADYEPYYVDWIDMELRVILPVRRYVA